LTVSAEIVEKIGRIYTVDGVKYPSVTTVLGALDKGDGLLQWRQRLGNEEADKQTKFATDIGTHFHLLCEQYLKKEELSQCNTEEEQLALKMFKPIRKILDKITPICQEQFVVSKTLRIAGRFDLLAYENDEVVLIDFKTSKDVKPDCYLDSYKLQLAFYANMIKESGLPEPTKHKLIIGTRTLFPQRKTFQPSETPMKTLKQARLNFYNKFGF
jgi:ATP-dependent exoDNAse (exonuclease V) beta subunit